MNQASTPPEPPVIRRAGSYYPAHVIGVLLLALLPALALVGAFDEQVNTASASTPGLLLEVRYVTRTRYSLRTTMEIVVENRTGSALHNVVVGIDRGYMEGFGSAQFRPEVTHSTPDALEIALPDLDPGAWRAIDAQMIANRIGSHDGRIIVWAESTGAEGAAEVLVETLILP